MALKFVLEGPGCSGTTTVAEMIGALVGIPIVNEAAREILEEIEREGTIHLHPTVDPVAFRREQLKRQLAAEAVFDHSDELLVCVRGAFTGIGFCRATTDYEQPTWDFLREVSGPRYELMFLLEQLPRDLRLKLYHDGVRYEDPDSDEMVRLPSCLERAYREKGVKVVGVPFMSSPLERVRFILEAISRQLDELGRSRRGSSLNRLQLDRRRSLNLQTA